MVLPPPPPPPPPNRGLSHAGGPATEPAAAESAHRTASSSVSPDPSPAHASADLSVIQRLRRNPAAFLLGLPLLLGLAAPAAAQAQNTVTFAEETVYASEVGTRRTDGSGYTDWYVTAFLDNTNPTDVYVHIRTVEPSESLNGYAPARIGWAPGLHDATLLNDDLGGRIPAGETEYNNELVLFPGSCGKYFFVEITKVTTDGQSGSTNIDSSVSLGNPSRVTVFITDFHCHK